MASVETITLFDKDDQRIEVMTLPAGYMDGESPRWVVVEGKKYVEGGGADAFYSKGQFAEVINGDAG